MCNSFKGNNSIILHKSTQCHNSKITCSHSIIKELSVTHYVEIIRETEEASEEEAMEEEDLEEVEDQ
jgi:hypothetical protein